MKKTERLQVRLDEETLSQLKKLAENDNRSMASLITILIKKDWHDKFDNNS